MVAGVPCCVRKSPALNDLRRREPADIAARLDLKRRVVNIEPVRKFFADAVEKGIV